MIELPTRNGKLIPYSELSPSMRDSLLRMELKESEDDYHALAQRYDRLRKKFEKMVLEQAKIKAAKELDKAMAEGKAPMRRVFRCGFLDLVCDDDWAREFTDKIIDEEWRKAWSADE